MHIFDVCYACSGIAAGCQPLFAAVSLSWTEELARFTMLWLIFLASSHIARKSSYIRVTFIIDRQPDKVKRILSVIVKDDRSDHGSTLHMELL